MMVVLLAGSDRPWVVNTGSAGWSRIKSGIKDLLVDNVWDRACMVSNSSGSKLG